MDVVLSRGGQEIGTMSHTYKRGKIISTTYHLPKMEG